MANRPTKICVFNDISNLIDSVIAVDGVITKSQGIASAGLPVVLNPDGLIDGSLLGLGTTPVTAAEDIAAGDLVHLYAVSAGSPPTTTLFMERALRSRGSRLAAPDTAIGFVSPLRHGVLGRYRALGCRRNRGV